jgi:hypothetical protein
VADSLQSLCRVKDTHSALVLASLCRNRKRVECEPLLNDLASLHLRNQIAWQDDKVASDRFLHLWQSQDLSGTSRLCQFSGCKYFWLRAQAREEWVGLECGFEWRCGLGRRD